MPEIQLGKSFYTSQVVGSDDVDALLGQLSQQVDRGLGSVAGAQAAEVAVGTDNRPSIAEVEFGYCHAKGKRIHHAPDKQQPLALATGQVLVQQQQVVAEVEISLAGVALG